MSTEKIVDRFHRESLEGVDAVLDRMCRAIDAIPDTGYAEALDVSKETVKTWRRRGEVPMKFLTGFARDHGVSLDYLRYGTEVHNEPASLTTGPAPALPDLSTLELAVEYVRNREQLEKRKLSAAQFAKAVRLAYQITLEEQTAGVSPGSETRESIDGSQRGQRTKAT